MPVIAVNPFQMKDVILKLGATNEYQKHVSAVEFVPSSSPVIFKGLGGNSHTLSGNSSWVCNLSFAQDWGTTDSLSRYLFEHEGETVAATFEPINGEDGFTANLTLVAGNIGGAVDAVAVSTVSLGSDKPVFIPAV